ncbi:helix-turn-helix transcriptional regulator [Pedobacter sp. GR22-6]|uniref:helix-turn-helix transcriptional regulator n=1 Tax=Pedobacter sp. GR22-6 TaxID=3127957 RepID=UPI00307FB4B4
MVNYYKYLPVSKRDEDWGLCVLNAGCTHIAPASNYPTSPHPTHHHFRWQNGRVLNEYQLIYVTEGSGIFESEQVIRQVEAGTVILLFPGVRHRYRPSVQHGWDEYWIGFKGKVIDDLVSAQFFDPGNPCIQIGINEQVFGLFNSVIEHTKREKAGYQSLISGATLHLLGSIHAAVTGRSIMNEDKENIINKARVLFRSNLTTEFSAEQAAEKLHISYSYFRKLFKSYTGISPGQFYIQLKIEKAKELLSDHSIPVKEIAYELRFESHFYFSKLFKAKTGLTPTAYRLRDIGKAELE